MTCGCFLAGIKTPRCVQEKRMGVAQLAQTAFPVSHRKGVAESLALQVEVESMDMNMLWAFVNIHLP